MRERLRTLIIKVPVTAVLLFLGMPVSAYAVSPEYHAGFENWISRDTVTPSYFPILNAGIFADSTTDPEKSVGDTHEYKIDAEFRISPTHPKAMALTGPNVYYGQSDHSYASPLRFSFGRRLIGWTKLDEMWNLGEFEPLDAWDRLRARPQGLTGIFAYSETNEVTVRFFASFIYLPEVVPNFVIENEQIVLEHPQAIANAPKTYNLLGLPTPIGYELKIPDLQKIVLRPSVAFQVESNFESPFKAKMAYGYLPLNYFPIALQGTLGIVPNTIFVTLHPRLLHQHLINGELTYRFSNEFSSGFVALFKDPVSEAIPADYTTTPLTPSQTYSPWIQYESPSWRLQLSQLWTFGGLDPDVGPFATPGASVFSSHVFYRNATQFKVRYLFAPAKKDSAYLDTRYLHEYSINADWLAADFVFFTQERLSFLVGGDLINALKTVADSRGAEFLADVRAVDRVRLGVQYVF